jgi:hypothetical protein
MSEMEINRAQPSTISENAPAVSMDIALGKKFKNVEFDYDAFDREAERIGMSQGHRGKLKIRLHDEGEKHGEYFPSDKAIELKTTSDVSKSLSHELQHATDDENGVPFDDLRNRLAYRANAILTSKVFLPATTGSILSYPAALVIGNPTLENISEDMSKGAVIAIGSLALVQFYAYWMHPNERKARMAEKSTREQIVSLAER